MIHKSSTQAASAPADLPGPTTSDRISRGLAIDRLAASLGIDALATAEGIIAVVTANMARAIRVIRPPPWQRGTEGSSPPSSATESVSTEAESPFGQERQARC